MSTNLNRDSDVEPGREGRARDHGRPTVMLLDDEAGIRGSLGRLLERSGFEVLSLADADAAFKYLRTAAVDALVLDVRLPAHRSGLEVLEFVRLDDEASDLPVIVLTGNVLTPDEEDIVRRHRAHVFYKPHGLGELALCLWRLCAGRAPSPGDKRETRATP